VGAIQSPLPALHPMEPQSPIQTLPQISVLDRHHLAKQFPPPPVAPPFRQAVLHAMPNVRAAAEQSHSGGLVEGLQRPHHRQQIQPLPAHPGFDVRCRKLFRAIGLLQREPPSARVPGGTDLGEQKIVWRGKIHLDRFWHEMGGLRFVLTRSRKASYGKQSPPGPACTSVPCAEHPCRYAHRIFAYRHLQCAIPILSLFPSVMVPSARQQRGCTPNGRTGPAQASEPKSAIGRRRLVRETAHTNLS